MAADDTGGKVSPGKLNLNWDTNTALAVMVLAALAFLWLVSRGFRGFTVGTST